MKTREEMAWEIVVGQVMQMGANNEEEAKKEVDAIVKGSFVVVDKFFEQARKK